jgi:3-methyladenine DNA glycosylase AlkD
MELDEVMAALEAAGTAQIRKLCVSQGVSGAMFGVSNVALQELTQRIGIDADLAAALWQTKNHDARILATVTADPESAEIDLLESWALDCDNQVIADAVTLVAARTVHGRALSDRLRDVTEEHASQIGWNLVAVLARAGSRPGRPTVPDEWFLPLLDEVERLVHSRPSRTRHSMNIALCSIGVGRKELREQALHVAAAIGEVKVDHGETPDATVVIQRLIVNEVQAKQMKKRMDRRERAKKRRR